MSLKNRFSGINFFVKLIILSNLVTLVLTELLMLIMQKVSLHITFAQAFAVVLELNKNFLSILPIPLVFGTIFALIFPFNFSFFFTLLIEVWIVFFLFKFGLFDFLEDCTGLAQIIEKYLPEIVAGVNVFYFLIIYNINHWHDTYSSDDDSSGWHVIFIKKK